MSTARTMNNPYLYLEILPLKIDSDKSLIYFVFTNFLEFAVNFAWIFDFEHFCQCCVWCIAGDFPGKPHRHTWHTES